MKETILINTYYYKNELGEKILDTEAMLEEYFNKVNQLINKT